MEGKNYKASIFRLEGKQSRQRNYKASILRLEGKKLRGRNYKASILGLEGKKIGKRTTKLAFWDLKGKNWGEKTKKLAFLGDLTYVSVNFLMWEHLRSISDLISKDFFSTSIMMVFSLKHKSQYFAPAEYTWTFFLTLQVKI